jgi:hypothetical protein
MLPALASDEAGAAECFVSRRKLTELPFTKDGTYGSRQRAIPLDPPQSSFDIFGLRLRVLLPTAHN